MSRGGSNHRKDALLGEPHGTAGAKLRKALLFKYVCIVGHAVCYRCRRDIGSVDDLSIEHIESWQRAANPRASFFDLNNIAFSHLRCNVDARDRHRDPKTHCLRGHALDESNAGPHPTGRGHRCRNCHRDEMRRLRVRNAKADVPGF